MDQELKIHLSAAGLLGLIIGVSALFWSYPKLLVYVLLVLVAALGYGALYLILAARLDPQHPPQRPKLNQPETESPAPATVAPNNDPVRKRKAKRKPRRKTKS